MQINLFLPRLTAVLSGIVFTLSLLLPLTGTAKDLPQYRQKEMEAGQSAIQDPVRAQRIARYIQDRYNLTPQNGLRIVNEAARSGARHGLELELILAVIAVESNFRERAVSPRGARGLMQVKADVHRNKIREIGGAHALFETDSNIHTGSRILADYVDSTDGNMRRALLYYCGSIKNPKSSYPDKVLRIYQDLKHL
ncbi:MAG: lytic transglycosylase domain-containing protein [Candidatus Competibacteraceae bacterium]